MLDSLMHYSSRLIHKWDVLKFKPLRVDIRPNGLWLSVGNAWETYTIANRLGTDSLRERYRVILEANTKLLTLSTKEEVIEFTRKYGRLWQDDIESFVPPLDGFSDVLPGSGCWIDWPEVSKHYQGVFVAPYEIVPGDMIGWHQAWMCSCGCIWDYEAIKNTWRII